MHNGTRIRSRKVNTLHGMNPAPAAAFAVESRDSAEPAPPHDRGATGNERKWRSDGSVGQEHPGQQSGTTRQDDSRVLPIWRVLVADRHPILRRGLCVLIDQEADLKCCGEAGTREELMALLAKEKPDLLTLDITLDEAGGVDLVKEVKRDYPELKVLVVSMYDEVLYAERSLRAGARGYVMKTEPVSRILAAVRKVLGGEVYVSEKFAARLLRRVTNGHDAVTRSPIEQLTDRELQVFHCIGQGMRLREIAQQLYVSVKTIEAHREHIKRKLNCASSSELLRYAIQAASPRAMTDPTQP